MKSDKIMSHTHIVDIEIENQDTKHMSSYEALNNKTSKELIEIMLKNTHDIINAFILYFNHGENRFLINRSWHKVRDYLKKNLQTNIKNEKILCISDYNKFIIPSYIQQHFLDCCIKEAFICVQKYYESVISFVRGKIHKWKNNRIREQSFYFNKIEGECNLLTKKIEVLKKEKNFDKANELKEKILFLKKEKKLINEQKLHIDELSHYAFSILSRDINLFFKCLKHKTPSIEETFYKNTRKNFVCSKIELANMARRIRKFAKKIMKRPPVRKSYRTAYFEESLYTIKLENGYLNISLKPFKGSRIKFITRAFLNRNSKITKNITFVSDYNKYYIHIPFNVKKYDKYKINTEKSIDLGYTETFTDNNGVKYGKNLGKLMSDFSDKINDKNKKINMYINQYKKELEQGHITKANNILKNNIGRKKYNKFYNRHKNTIINLINYTINQLLGLHNKPRGVIKTLIIENLSSNFKFKFSKKMNRRLSFWLRGYIKERIEFKTNKFCVNLIQVNPAYTSQLCPECFYIDSKNRNGDYFKCKRCSYEGDADHIAAKNIFTRAEYKEITIYTSKEDVKKFFNEKQKKLDISNITNKNMK